MEFSTGPIILLDRRGTWVALKLYFDDGGMHFGNLQLFRGLDCILEAGKSLGFEKLGVCHQVEFFRSRSLLVNNQLIGRSTKSLL